MRENMTSGVVGPCWVVYETKDYAGTRADEIVSIHTDPSTIEARVGQTVRKWSRFHVRPLGVAFRARRNQPRGVIEIGPAPRGP